MCFNVKRARAVAFYYIFNSPFIFSAFIFYYYLFIYLYFYIEYFIRFHVLCKAVL